LYPSGGGTPIIILATQEADIRRITVGSQPGQIFVRPYHEKKKNPSQKGLVEWLKL
jgi:hypothetical protein